MCNDNKCEPRTTQVGQPADNPAQTKNSRKKAQKTQKKKSRRAIRVATCEARQPEIFALGSPWPTIEFSAVSFLCFLRLFAAIPPSSRPFDRFSLRRFQPARVPAAFLETHAEPAIDCP